MKKRIFTIVCVILFCISDGLISTEQDNLSTYLNENGIPAEPEQLRLFLLKGYNSAKSVIDDVRIEYQTTQIHVNIPPINISNFPETSTSVCEYIQKNNKERWINLNVSIGKTVPPEDLSYHTELVRTEDSSRFKVFDGQYILDYSRVNNSYNSGGRAILESNKTGFFESTDLLSERAPVRFFGYWPSLMPDDVLSSPQVDIETKPEKIGELLTYKVSAVLEMVDVFEISYWLSPERSCLPVKIEVWRNGRFSSRLETKGFIELEDGRWAIKSILQRNYVNWDDREEPYELVNFLYTIRKIELHPEIDEDIIFDTSPDSLPEGAQIVDNRSVPRLKYINGYASSLIDKPLPELKEIGINLSQANVNDKMMLICIFDYQQRPSRNCILQLSQKAYELKAQEISVVAIHISKIEKDTLDKWIKENEIPFPIGVIEAEEEKTRFNWGVKSLPWLILTDKNHVVIDEGFSISELDEKITNFAESITPLMLLEKYKANKSAVEKQIIKSEEFVERVDTSLGNEPEFDLYEYECRRNDNKLDFIFSKQRGVEFDEKGSVLSSMQSHKKRVIWDDKEWSQVIYRTSTSAFFSSTGERKNQFMASSYGGNCLDGFFWGDLQSIDVILDGSSNMKIRSQMEKVNGIDCYVIDANTPNGNYTLWFDPKHGYQIAKAKSYKSGEDLFFGKPVSMDIEIKAGTKVSRKQPGKIKDVLFSLEIVKFQKISDIWVPIEADYQTTTNCDDRTTTYKKNLKRTYVDLDPDFEAVNAFIPDIPEGTKVTYEDSPGINYIWQNGKRVPVKN